MLRLTIVTIRKNSIKCGTISKINNVFFTFTENIYSRAMKTQFLLIQVSITIKQSINQKINTVEQIINQETNQGILKTIKQCENQSDAQIEY